MNVKALLETTLQYPEQVWSWALHENPIDYTIIDPNKRCDAVGNQIFSFDEKFGYLTLPGNESSTWNDVEISKNLHH